MGGEPSSSALRVTPHLGDPKSLLHPSTPPRPIHPASPPSCPSVPISTPPLVQTTLETTKGPHRATQRPPHPERAFAEAFNPATPKGLALDPRSQNGGWLRRETFSALLTPRVAPASACRNAGAGGQGWRCRSQGRLALWMRRMLRIRYGSVGGHKGPKTKNQEANSKRPFQEGGSGCPTSPIGPLFCGGVPNLVQ